MMRERIYSPGAADPPVSETSVPQQVGLPDHGARIAELEIENHRLLQLVGELLVANQKLRER